MKALLEMNAKQNEIKRQGWKTSEDAELTKITGSESCCLPSGLFFLPFLSTKLTEEDCHSIGNEAARKLTDVRCGSCEASLGGNEGHYTRAQEHQGGMCTFLAAVQSLALLGIIDAAKKQELLTHFKERFTH